MIEFLRALGVRGVIVVALLIGLGVWVRTHFLRYIDADATFTGTGSVLGGDSYVAHVNVHMGGPVDVKCIVKGKDGDSEVVVSDSFSLEAADRTQTHHGTLDLTALGRKKATGLGIDIETNLDIACVPS
jgi:hypothetical protein